MRIEPLGDSAAIVRDFQEPAHLVSARLENLPGVIEAVASYVSVGLYFEPGALSNREAWDAFEIAVRECAVGTSNSDQPKTLVVPICYEFGEDLAEVALALRITEDALIESHSTQDYRCYAIGFTPGFPYLGYLSPTISGLGRRPEPRVRVEPGSVGITGNQTGIYPALTPGGWNLIGRTPLTIVSLAEAYFPIAAGDIVRFSRIDDAEFRALEGERL